MWRKPRHLFQLTGNEAESVCREVQRKGGAGGYQKHLEKGESLHMVELGQTLCRCRDEGYLPTKK